MPGVGTELDVLSLPPDDVTEDREAIRAVFKLAIKHPCSPPGEPCLDRNHRRDMDEAGEYLRQLNLLKHVRPVSPHLPQPFKTGDDGGGTGSLYSALLGGVL